MSIKLEVSLGEALDKLTILDIKLEKIKDNRKILIINEFTYLSNELQNYIEIYNYYYKILKKFNLEIWNLQDIIRNSITDKNNFYIICDKILNLNDARYLVKKKINEVCNSNFKEQKGYNLRCLNIILNCNENIINELNGAIRYYSFYYDEIYLYCNISECESLKKIYMNDPFIKINLNNKNIDYTKYDNIIINNYDDIKICLSHSYFVNKEKITNNNIQLSDNINKLYEKLNLEISIYDEYKF